MSKAAALSSFRQAVYNMAKEMKIPIVDERAIDQVRINKNAVSLDVQIKYRPGEELKIKTYLAIAKYHHSVVLYKGETFFLVANNVLWRLST